LYRRHLKIIYNPYQHYSLPSRRTLKCNFHVHDPFPEDPDSFAKILKVYKEKEYAVIMNSGQQRFEDTCDLSSETGIATLNGQEYIEKDGLLLAGIRSFIMGSPTEAVETCVSQGGFCVACHPNLSESVCPDALTAEEIKAMDGLLGIEILNGCVLSRQKIGQFIGDPYACDVWDEMLSAGKKIWGFAFDDSHGMEEIDVAWTDIYAESGSLEDILVAVREGCFCASTGLRLNRFSLVKDSLTIEAYDPYNPEAEFEYRFIGYQGAVLSDKKEKNACYTIPEGAFYIRVEVSGANGRKLWTQPIFK